VAAGQKLLRLDTTEDEADRAALMAERDALAARGARLRAELEGAAAPDFSALVSENPDRLAAAISGQAALFEAREAERASEREMLEGTLRRLAAQRAAIEAELESAGAQLALLEEDAAAARALAERSDQRRCARASVRWPSCAAHGRRWRRG
jgi:hypothetical protein